MADTLYKWRMKTIKEDSIHGDDDKADKLAAHGHPKAKKMRR